MELYPIGEPVSSTAGSLGAFFEPNDGATGATIRNVQTLTMQDMTIDIYEKNGPFRRLEYKYKDIFHREYVRILKFAELVEGGLNSFHMVDLSMGEYVGQVASPYVFSLSFTNYYSPVSSIGAHYAFAWDGTQFMIGSVASVDSSNIDLTRVHGASALSNATLYPIYEVYAQPGSFDSFTTTNFYDSKGTADHGRIWEGSVMCVTKFPLR